MSCDSDSDCSDHVDESSLGLNADDSDDNSGYEDLPPLLDNDDSDDDSSDDDDDDDDDVIEEEEEAEESDGDNMNVVNAEDFNVSNGVGFFPTMSSNQNQMTTQMNKTLKQMFGKEQMMDTHQNQKNEKNKFSAEFESTFKKNTKHKDLLKQPTSSSSATSMTRTGQTSRTRRNDMLDSSSSDEDDDGYNVYDDSSEDDNSDDSDDSMPPLAYSNQRLTSTKPTTNPNTKTNTTKSQMNTKTKPKKKPSSTSTSTSTSSSVPTSNQNTDKFKLELQRREQIAKQVALHKKQQQQQNEAQHKISIFTSTHYHRRQALRSISNYKSCIIKIQTLVRGWQIRLVYGDLVKKSIENWNLFISIWKPCLDLMIVKKENMVTNGSGSGGNGGNSSGSVVASNWSSIREEQCFIKLDDLLDDDENGGIGIGIEGGGTGTDDNLEKLDDAIADVVNDMVEQKNQDSEDEEDKDDDENEIEYKNTVLDDIEIETTIVQPPTKLKSNNNNNNTTTNETKAEEEEEEEVHLLGEHTHIQFTSDVVKWLRTNTTGDAKYREFFIRRMKQLSSGDRSRILAKKLRGSKRTIYETYLEQKSGFRILWTEEGRELLVWYVAKHKNVSRLIQLIDDSESRSTRQHKTASEVLKLEKSKKRNGRLKNDADYNDNGGDEGPPTKRTILDPLGNVPLKVYEIKTEDIGEMKSDQWAPHLRLTEEEREIVETKDTVLLLGRSGTGKTVCICNRMEYDRQTSRSIQPLRQLFVARSERLCNYVTKTVGTKPQRLFTTFDKITSHLEETLVKVNNVREVYHPSQRMDFGKFKREIYNKDVGIDALLIWTNIRSFIKGSIEIVRNGEDYVLSRDDYLSNDQFGTKRCRLSREHRSIVYDVYLTYQEYMDEYGLWDDMDRIVSLLKRFKATESTDLEIFDQVRYDKIYVDEIQDYTQIECLLFFYLGGPGNLFLAGDPAQSVVEGVEFRFEDVRSVGYHVAGSNNRSQIPQKPLTVNVNFRSHTGILKTAASVLSLLFKSFPDSAKQLKEDRGLFEGPRPGFFHKVDTDLLANILSNKLNGTFVITHDHKVSHYRKLLDYPLVIGMREAKGLEFKSVIILNFFADLPDAMQIPWREILLNRANDKFKERYPEVEGYLKLLYTAVTRCINRLFFAETKSGIAGDAFLRWATTTNVKGNSNTEPLATKNDTKNVDMMEMTQDEWLAAGIESAEAGEAEAKNNLEQADGLFERAIYCFEQSKNEVLEHKARIHRSSIKLRLKLVSSSTDTDEEANTAKMLQKLLEADLYTEGRDLSVSLLPHLSEDFQKRMHKEFIKDLSHGV